MTEQEARDRATKAMLDYLANTKEHTPVAAKTYRLVLREYNGRWNIYSIDLDQWHVMVSDNGGRIEQILDCSRV